MISNVSRFIKPHMEYYTQALAEITDGRKKSHWMWFIFPQLKGLGISEFANFYGIQNIKEAETFINHPLLGVHLIEITMQLLNHQNQTANQIFGTPDDIKLKSSMTLFSLIPKPIPLFEEVIKIFYKGCKDERTIKLLD